MRDDFVSGFLLVLTFTAGLFMGMAAERTKHTNQLCFEIPRGAELQQAIEEADRRSK